MSYELGMQRLLEYQRLIVVASLTEEGPFAPKEEPDDLSSSFVAKVEVCYAVVHVDKSGRIRLTTYNPPDLMNKTRETGLPIALPEGRIIRSGSKSPNIETEWLINPHLTEEENTLSAYVWAAFEREMGDWTI